MSTRPRSSSTLPTVMKPYLTGNAWNDMVRHLEMGRKFVLHSLLSQMMKGHVEGDVLIIESPPAFIDQLQEKKNLDTLYEALEAATGRKMEIRPVLAKGNDDMEESHIGPKKRNEYRRIEITSTRNDGETYYLSPIERYGMFCEVNKTNSFLKCPYRENAGEIYKDKGFCFLFLALLQDRFGKSVRCDSCLDAEGV